MGSLRNWVRWGVVGAGLVLSPFAALILVFVAVGAVADLADAVGLATTAAWGCLSAAALLLARRLRPRQAQPSRG